MIELISALFEFLIFTVVVKGIVAHSLSKYIVKYCKTWLDARPQRREHYEALLHYHRTKPELI